jgi:hypothetical protein
VEDAPSDRRPRMDGVIGRESEPLWQAVPQIRDAVSEYAASDPELDR